uniref:Unkown protein n=1 Tax=Riptortus pedestris TaxID=329032 RepID=R4WD75_RIPPE|nr:unkown protein [Riptortus pedestris]
MKSLSVILLFAIVGAWSDDFSQLMPDPSWAKPFVSLKANKNPLKADDTCPGPYSCSSCNVARVCKPTDKGFEVVQEIQCPSDRPFCNSDTGTCVAEAPGNCGGPDDDFICMGNGRYPDKSCNKFHVCLDYHAKSFECKIEGHAYNPKTQVCEPSAACGSFDCSTNQVRKAAHDVSSRYFAYCNQDSQGPLVIDSCPPQFKLDTETQLCTPDCTKDGIIADPSDCHHYYKCTNIHLRRDMSYWKVDRLKCIDGQAYSPEEFLCVDESKVSTCPKKTMNNINELLLSIQ